MIIEPTAIADVFIVRLKKHADERGFFSETYRADSFRDAGIAVEWLQDNHAFSARSGVVRGLHFQAAPYAQAKLIRVAYGAIYDVAVDIRRGSPTYGKHIGLELSARNWLQLYIPEGIAHGYCTLSEENHVLYKTSTVHSPEAEGGLCWNDPAFDIDWPVAPEEAILSARDRAWPPFESFQSPFA